jgi:hypothetical protein
VAAALATSNLTACKSNLKNLGTALEMYSCDYDGHYPPTMTLLTPNYLRIIPECPSAGKDTYSTSYQTRISPDYGHSYATDCQGHNHKDAGLPADYPQYNSVQGLIER